MLAGFITFDSIPEIGFAHHHYSGNHIYSYEKNNKSFEIVYISSGSLSTQFNGKTFPVHAGDIMVLFRQLPIKLYAQGGEEQSHCTVQLEFDYTFKLIDLDGPLPNEGIILPFVTGRCALTEEIKRELFETVHLVSSSADRRNFSAALKTVGIMQKLDSIARSSFDKTNPAHSHIAALVESYVNDNIGKKIHLSDISAAVGKSPNYINFAFKNTVGITVTEYINGQKISTVSSLMQKHGMSFSEACNFVGITDVSYGYRLFKKHTGLTPNKFLQSEQILIK